MLVRNLLFMACLILVGNMRETLAAAEIEPKDKPPFAIARPFSRMAQNVCGATFIGQCIASQVAQSILRKKLGGKPKVRIRSWSVTDMLAGKVKVLEIALLNCEFKGVPLGNLQIKSQTPIAFQYRRQRGNSLGNRRGLKSPILLSVKGTLNEKDIARILSTQEVTGRLRGLKLDLPGLGEQELQILAPNITLDKDKMTIKALLATLGSSQDTAVSISISGNLKLIEGDRLVLQNMIVSSPDILEPEKFSGFLEELFNPIVDFRHFDRPQYAFRLNSFELKAGKIDCDGRLLIAPG